MSDPAIEQGARVRIKPLEGTVLEVRSTPLQNPSPKANHLRGKLQRSVSLLVQMDDGRILTLRPRDLDLLEPTPSSE